MRRRIRWVLRTILIVFVNAAGILIFDALIPGIKIDNFLTAVLAVVAVSILNSFVFPIFSRLTLILSVLTLGLGGLVVNGIVIYFMSELLPGLQLDNVLDALIFIFGVTIVNAVTSMLLAIDDDEVYRRNVIKKLAKKTYPKVNTKTPGVIFIQIDGLSYNVLMRAIGNGNVPYIAKLLRSGSHRLEKWETDWQSQTGASQAGILMGKNRDIPAFRWYDKKLKRTIAVSRPSDVKFVEKELSNGRGLLFKNGASRGNLFSGDARETLLTASSIGKKGSKNLGHGYFAYFATPYNLPRTMVLFVMEVFREIKSIIEQNRRDVWPRLSKHKKTYPFLRAAMTIVQRDILVQTIIGDVFEGRNVVYADLVGYDEVAHHTGPERYETLAVLRNIDNQIKRIVTAFNECEKPYYLVLLSDHGQTQGPTFKQTMGYGLDELVQRLIEGKPSVDKSLENDEGADMFRNAVFEVTKTGGLIGKTIKSTQRIKPLKKESLKNTDVKVLASGALGLIYFCDTNKRLVLEDIEKKYPQLIPGLIEHPYIDFILVNSRSKGGIVMGRDGTYFIESGKVTGQNPLDKFGKKATTKVGRTNSYKNAADIMINGYYDDVMNEIYGFEEQVGSHGALGGDQSYPFVFFPKDWYYPREEILGAENVHKLFKQWLGELGQGAQ